jgi:ribonucleoside-diphosphate reductase subunit M2
MDTQEDILTETRNRFVLYPIQYQDIWKMYKTAVGSFWQVEEIDFSKDIDDWNNKLNENERNFIENILAFFAASDGLVDENLITRFYQDVKVPEAKAFYAFQIAAETIHSETYSLMLNSFVKDPTKRDKLFNGIHTIPGIRKKAEWSMKWIEHPDAPFSLRLLAFAIIEGVFFQSAFASIYWLKERNIMNGLCSSNVLISRDESLHVEFAILLYSTLKNKQDQSTVHEVIKEAVEIETEFITESIPCSLLGMNNTLMSEYVQFVADRLAVQLGYDKIYDAKNPFPFMERMSLENKDNFFETRSLDYSKANIGQTQSNIFDFSITEEF